MSREIASAPVSARALLREAAAGVLASHCVAVPGYPLGSLVPYVLTPEGRAVFYISRIAQHTKNLEKDPRVSLTATEADLTGAKGDPQASGRVSILGDASPAAGTDLDAARARYETFFPESAGHADVHDFDFWQIEPVRIRFIGGFGAIQWVEADEFCLPRMEWQDSEAGIVKHMNEDHRDAMALMWQRQQGSRPDSAGEDEPTMLASDPEGFHMRWGQQVAYVRYAKLCETALDVRKEMVRLTKEARGDR
jgi:putative heme iron utilization protein